MADTPLPTTAEEEAALLEATDNGPRPEDGDQPDHIPAPDVLVDDDGHGLVLVDDDGAPITLEVPDVEEAGS
jgi:hypothetical protein